MRTITIRVVGLLFSVALISTMIAAPAAANPDEQEEFLVDLDESGNANISLTLTYNLDSDEERDAFEELRENTTAQEEFAERFENRMTVVAEDASNATDREMSVGSARVEIETGDDIGVVTLTVPWENLAAVDGGRLTVTEPFSSGFDPGLPFSVAVPDGYEIVSSSPEASSSDEASVTWEAGASLQGFELVAEPAAENEESPEDDTDADGAGFGVVAVLWALLAAALLVARKQ